MAGEKSSHSVVHGKTDVTGIENSAIIEGKHRKNRE